MSDERFWLSVWAMLFTAVLGLAAMLVFGLQESENVRKLRIQSDFQIKHACIVHGGNWNATDNDSRPPYSCKMR